MADVSNSTTPGNRETARLQWRLLLALVAITLATFINSCGNGFVQYDDSINIYGNPRIQSLSVDNLKWMFTDTQFAQRYMPLGWLSYAVDYHFFGANAAAYHIGNLLLHIANVVVLFFFLKRLLNFAVNGAPRTVPARAVIWCAAVGALFWAVNPLRTEPVAWASSRPYCLMFLLAFISLLSWMHARTARLTSAHRIAWITLSISTYAASLLTYPLALFLPASIVVLDAYRLGYLSRRFSDWDKSGLRHFVTDKIPHLAVAAAMIAVVFLARVATDLDHRPTSLREFGVFSRLMQACYIVSYYLWKPWVPFNLAVCYPTLHSFNPLGIGFVFSALMASGATFIVIKWRQRWPALLALWLCHLALLVPVLGLTEYPHSACDRYSYLHGVLWSVAIAALVLTLWHRDRLGQFAAAIFGGASILFAFAAHQQVTTWHSPVSFYRQVIAVHREHPHRARFDAALARNYLGLGFTNEAVASLQDSVRYESVRADRRIYGEALLPSVQTQLGDVLRAQGRHEEALACYRAALISNPNWESARNRIAQLQGK